MIDAQTAKEMREKDPFEGRNVADRFLNKTADEIKTELATTASELLIVASNQIKDFNWGSVVRSVNSFNCSGIVFTGRKAYDRRGAVGANNYTAIDYLPDMDMTIGLLKSLGYRVIACEYDERFDMQPLPTYEWQAKTAVIFGEEGLSLSGEVLDQCDDVVYIPMYGSVRSLNLASCATTVMYDYDCKMRFGKVL